MVTAILLVEDNPDDERLAIRAIRTHAGGRRILVAHDGAEAMSLLTGPSPIAIELVLLDLKLPKVGGLEVLRRLRENPSTALVPVVVLTSSHEDADQAMAMELGADMYLEKGVDFDAFERAIGQIQARWLPES